MGGVHGQKLRQQIPDPGKGKILKATCTLWHMQVLFAGKTQGNFNPPPGSKGGREPSQT
jgi:hypothetical protein